MIKSSGTDYPLHGMIDMPERIMTLEKRVSALEAEQMDDIDLLNQITDLKRCISYLAEYVAQLKGISVSEVIGDIGVLR